MTAERKIHGSPLAEGVQTEKSQSLELRKFNREMFVDALVQGRSRGEVKRVSHIKHGMGISIVFAENPETTVSFFDTSWKVEHRRRAYYEKPKTYPTIIVVDSLRKNKLGRKNKIVIKKAETMFRRGENLHIEGMNGEKRVGIAILESGIVLPYAR